MVFFNYATMQMAAKIVYYGPGLCGKTTNLHHIYAKTSPQSRGEMVSLETETDRTLFFDLLPIDVGVIGGFKTRLQLYTIPGQVFYNTTRKLVLKGVDGIVFVADSQMAMLDANLESFKNLRENLGEIGLSIDEIPLVLQLNKRDLPNIAPADAVVDVIDPERTYDWAEAVASRGDGVFETLKVISKLTLRTLRRRMTGEEPVKATARRPLADVASFRIREDAASPARTTAGITPPPSRFPDQVPFRHRCRVRRHQTCAAAGGPVEHVEDRPPSQVIETPEEISADAEVPAGDSTRALVARNRRAEPRARTAARAGARTGDRFRPDRKTGQSGAPRSSTSRSALRSTSWPSLNRSGNAPRSRRRRLPRRRKSLRSMRSATRPSRSAISTAP